MIMKTILVFTVVISALVVQILCNILFAIEDAESVGEHTLEIPNPELCNIIYVDHAREIFVKLIEIFGDEPHVHFKPVPRVDTLTWASGQKVRYTNELSKNESTLVAVFPRQPPDRKCLIPPPYPTYPQATAFVGVTESVESLVTFINTNCFTFKNFKGQPTTAGLHRDYIRESLSNGNTVRGYSMGDIYFERGRHTGARALLEQSRNASVCRASSSPNAWPDEATTTTSSSRNAWPDEVTTTTSGSRNAWPDEATTTTRGTRHVREKLRSRWRAFEEVAQCPEVGQLPSAGRFFQEYLQASKPVIFRGALRFVQWPAPTKWTTEFFTRHLGDRSVPVKLAPGGIFEGVEPASLWDDHQQFQRNIPSIVKEKLRYPDLVVVRPAVRNMNVSEFFRFINNTGDSDVSGYLEYSSIRQYLPELESDISEFSFIKDLLTLRHVNIWISNGDTLGKLHFDPFDNMLVQLRGKKQVIMFGPHDATRLYEAHIPEAALELDDPASTSGTRSAGGGLFRRRRLMDSTAMVMSPVDILRPDFHRFPKLREAVPQNCTIGEGDVLFMPAFWWHEVQSFPSAPDPVVNMAVNFWYEPFLTKEFPCPECRLDVNPLYRHLL